MVFKSELLSGIPGLCHGFGSRDEPISKEMAHIWSESLPRWKQVHGTACTEVDSAQQNCGEVDALFTFKTGLPIAVVTADCVPILLAKKSAKKLDGAVAAVHAGWRGTLAGIVRVLGDALIARGEVLSEWVAAVGPSIGPCCYEVSEELAQNFKRVFDPRFGSLAVPCYRTLDLPAMNEAELRSIGIGEVELIRACTRCSGSPGNEIFHSFRREGGGTRQYSMIMTQ